MSKLILHLVGDWMWRDFPALEDTWRVCRADSRMAEYDVSLFLPILQYKCFLSTYFDVGLYLTLLSSTDRISSPRVSVIVNVSAMISMLFLTINLASVVELFPALVTVTDFSASSSSPAEEGEELIWEQNNIRTTLDQHDGTHHNPLTITKPAWRRDCPSRRLSHLSWFH